MSVEHTAYGAGTRTYERFPNVLRLIIGECEGAEQKTKNHEQLTLIESNIDDVSPQILGFVMDRSFELGALDCWFTPIQMKKNRPATMISILCEADKKDTLTRLLYTETTTIGVRLKHVERECLDREIVTTATEFGDIDVKIAKLDGKVVNLIAGIRPCEACRERTWSSFQNSSRVDICKIYRYKMDLVDYSQEAYEKIKADYLEFAAKVGIDDGRFIPLSALNGDMIVERGEQLGWYEGPTLMEILEAAPAAHTEHDEPFRYPVQYVCRPQDSANPELHDYRGFMGRVESGSIQVGDAVTVLPSGRESTFKAVQLGGVDIGEAFTEQSITLLLADEIDTSRGDMIVKSGEVPAAVKQIEATV